MRGASIAGWLAAIAICAVGIVCRDVGLVGLAYAIGVVLASITVVATSGDGRALARPRLHDALLGPLLCAAFVTALAAGSTITQGGHAHILLGTVNVLLAIATWRELRSPRADATASLGAIAVGIELFAAIGDAAIARSMPSMYVIVAGAITSLSGGLSCIAALACFERGADLPRAQLVRD